MKINLKELQEKIGTGQGAGKSRLGFSSLPFLYPSRVAP